MTEKKNTRMGLLFSKFASEADLMATQLEVAQLKCTARGTAAQCESLQREMISVVASVEKRLSGLEKLIEINKARTQLNYQNAGTLQNTLRGRLDSLEGTLTGVHQRLESVHEVLQTGNNQSESGAGQQHKHQQHTRRKSSKLMTLLSP